MSDPGPRRHTAPRGAAPDLAPDPLARNDVTGHPFPQLDEERAADIVVPALRSVRANLPVSDQSPRRCRSRRDRNQTTPTVPITR